MAFFSFSRMHYRCGGSIHPKRQQIMPNESQIGVLLDRRPVETPPPDNVKTAPWSIYLSPPFLGGQEIDYIRQAIDSNWIAPVGPHIDAFEREVAQYAGVAGAVALSSGTAALHLAMRLTGVRPGDTVFCSSLTFVASANPIVYLGATPVFIDSEPESWNMSPRALEAAFRWAEKNRRLPRAVVVVDLYGQCADMDAIRSLCDRYETPIVEDAAEALGAAYRGKSAGALGSFGVFSFNGNKIITTSNGGMLVSDDLEALSKARYLSTQAREPVLHYEHCEIGYNYRLSNVLAGIGRAQLRCLDRFVNARRAIYSRYVNALGDVKGFAFMPEASYGRSTHWLTTMTIDPLRRSITPRALIDYLARQGIEARPVWKPLHLQPLYRSAPYFPHCEGESISEELFRRGVCLPSGSGLSEEDQDRVIQTVFNGLEDYDRIDIQL
jgi:pyridoxal phosphate-dependent aminotransferase EpsN